MCSKSHPAIVPVRDQVRPPQADSVTLCQERARACALDGGYCASYPGLEVPDAGWIHSGELFIRDETPLALSISDLGGVHQRLRSETRSGHGHQEHRDRGPLENVPTAPADSSTETSQRRPVRPTVSTRLHLEPRLRESRAGTRAVLAVHRSSVGRNNSRSRASASCFNFDGVLSPHAVILLAGTSDRLAVTILPSVFPSSHTYS